MFKEKKERIRRSRTYLYPLHHWS